MLGLVGGLAGIIWGTLAMLLGGYETFKFENSLIGSVYPTSPTVSGMPSDESKARQTMLRTVAERGKYHYNYCEYLWTSLLRCLCCCRSKGGSGCMGTRVKRLERHETASE